MSPLAIFSIYLGSVISLGLAAVLVYLRIRLLYQGRLSRALNLELLSVRFPSIPQTQEQQQQQGVQHIREKIALMEQFYNHLGVLKDKWWKSFLYGKPVFVLELTVPHIGEELHFYIAVPRRFVPGVEKIIQGIFPEAHIEPSRDYNIFNPEGAAVASSLVFKESKFYPIRTYQKLETDPMKAMTNVFTRLASEGEGAALQVIARPARKKWRRKLKDKAKIIYGAKKERADILIGTINTIAEATAGSSSEPQQHRPEELKKLTPMQEEMGKNIEAKAGKTLFETNIRVVASAADLRKAEIVLQGLEVVFAQFNDPLLNSFRVDRVEGRKLKKLLFNFSFRIFDESKSVVLGSEELTSIFHFPNTPLETPKMRIQKAREAAAPPNLPGEGLLLGYNAFRGDKADIRLMDDDRRRHLYMIGQTGTGKSVFLENMIIQDMQNGRGVCVIDPHGELVGKMLEFVPRERIQDVIYFNPGDTDRPMGLNMLEYDTRFPEQKTFIVNELFSIFQQLYGAVPEALGPMFEQYFRNATMLVMDDPETGNTLLEISRVMSDRVYRHLKISRAKNIVVKNFWTEVAEKAGGEGELKNMVPYITSKFDVFLANEIMRPIIAQEKSSFNFREIMDKQKIFLVNLSKGRLGDINSSLIGLIIVSKLLMAALSRVDSDQESRKDFYLYIDEFQNVTTNSIATILSEARKYRLDLIITHQFIGQLKEEIKKAVFGNVGSMVSFRIGSDDAEFVAKQFKPVFGEQDLLNIDNFNCYVKLLVRGQTTQPFSMKTYPPVAGNKEVAELVKELSRTKFGRPREEVEKEIMERSTKPEF